MKIISIIQGVATAGAASAVLAFGGAGVAQGSTNGCMDARFTCGDEISAQANSMEAQGWVYGPLRDGAKVRAGLDMASSAGTDWKVIADGPTVAFEAAPGGHPSGLYLGTSGTSTVTLRPFSMGWDVHWEAEQRDGGTVYVNDMTGEAIAPLQPGGVLRTGPVHAAGLFRFRGHIDGS
jgi:hypothetical protein